MQFDIPDCQVVDNDLDIVAMDSQRGRFIALTMERALMNTPARDMVEVRPYGLLVDGRYQLLLAWRIDFPYPTLILTFESEPLRHEVCLVLCSKEGDVWNCSSKLLYLPLDPLDTLGDGDQGSEQTAARILAFLALVNANGWFRNEPVAVSQQSH